MNDDSKYQIREPPNSFEKVICFDSLSCDWHKLITSLRSDEKVV